MQQASLGYTGNEPNIVDQLWILHTLGDSIDTCLRKMCCKAVNWIEMAQDRF
jgi:hypothetical protein